MKFVIMQFSPQSVLLPFSFKHPPQQSVLRTPQSMFFPQRDQVLHPYNTTGKITVLYLLIFSFFDMGQEDKRFQIE